MRKVGVAQLKRKADAAFSLYVRYRDSVKRPDGYYAACITCGTEKPVPQMQAGHFVKRSVSLLRYDDRNVNAQCMQCNVYKYGEQYAYARALDLKYGEGTADELHKQRFSTHKFTIPELEQVISEAKDYVKELL